MSMVERITTLMQEQRITKADLFHISGLKRSTFYNVFDPKTDPEKIRVETMRPIAAALNTTIDYLITGKVESENTEPQAVNTIITIGQGGVWTSYNVDDDDFALVINILKKIKRD